MASGRKRGALGDITNSNIVSETSAKRQKIEVISDEILPSEIPSAPVPNQNNRFTDEDEMASSRKRAALGDITNCDIVNSETSAKRQKIEVLSDEIIPSDLPSAFALNLDTIPEEMMRYIFKILPPGDQLNVAATNRRLNDCFISNLKNFSFTLDFDTNYLPEIDRHYSTVVFKNLTKPETGKRKKEMNTLFKTMGPHIKDLTFIDAKVTEKFFSKVMRFCPNVESLTFCSFKIYASDFFSALPFKHLKKISFDDSTSVHSLRNILTYVNTLQEFESEFYESNFEEDEEYMPKENMAICDILTRQNKLKKLIITSDEIFMDALQDSNYGFQLDTLLISISDLSKFQSQNMNSFVLQQRQLKTVTLNVRCDYKSNNFIKTFEHILRSRELKSLSLVFYKASTMDVFYNQCSIINPRVEKLFISVCQTKRRRFIEATSKMFPNLKALTLKLDNSWMNSPANTFTALNTLTNLETLKFDAFRTNMMQTLAIPSLKTLQVFPFTQFDRAQFDSFLKKNQQLNDCSIALGNVNIHSTIQVIESLVMNLPKITNIFVCTCQESIPASDMADLRTLIEQSSSSLRHLKICGEIFNF